MVIPVGSFEEAWPAVRRLDLVGEAVAGALEKWPDRERAASVLVVDTDPAKADTAEFCAA